MIYFFAQNFKGFSSKLILRIYRKVDDYPILQITTDFHFNLRNFPGARYKNKAEFSDPHVIVTSTIC